MRQKDLEAVRQYNNLIYTQQIRIEQLRAAAAYGSQALDPVGGSHGSLTNKLELIVERIDKVERKVDELEEKKAAATRKIFAAVKAELEDEKQKHIIYLRYIATNNGRPLEWDEVIKLVKKRHKIQERRIYELHHIAVKKLERYNI